MIAFLSDFFVYLGLGFVHHNDYTFNLLIQSVSVWVGFRDPQATGIKGQNGASLL